MITKSAGIIAAAGAGGGDGGGGGGYEATVEAVAPLVWWKLNDLTAAAGGLALTAEGGAAVGGADALPQEAGTTATALTGAGQYLSTPDHPSLRLAAGTIVVWCKPTSAAAAWAVWSKEASGLNAGDAQLWYNQPTDELRWAMQTAGTQEIVSVAGAVANGFVALNQPQCYACLWGPGGMELYRNGVLIGSRLEYEGGIELNGNPFFIGASRTGAGSTPNNFFAGTIDHAQIYNRRLTLAELRTLAQFQPPATGAYEAAVQGLQPRAYLFLAEQGGTTLADASGNGHAAGVNGAPTFAAGPAPVGVGADNFAINFGTTGDASIAHAAAFEAEEVMIASWVKWNAPLTNGAHAWSKGTLAWGPWNACGVHANADGSLRAWARHSHREAEQVAPAGTVVAGTWYHVAVRFGRDGLTCWLNGRQLEDGYPDLLHCHGWRGSWRGATHLNTNPLLLGKGPDGARGNVQLDEFVIFATRNHLLRKQQAAVSTMAGSAAAPPPLAHPIWGLRTRNATTTATAQAAIDELTGLNPPGGRVILANGNYGQLTIRSNVEVVAANRDGAVLTAPPVTPNPADTAIANSGNNGFAAGQRVFTINNAIAVGSAFKIKGAKGALGGDRKADFTRRWDRGAPEDHGIVDGEIFEIEARTATTLTFKGGGSYFAIPAANIEGLSHWTPTRNIGLRRVKVQTPAGGSAHGLQFRKTHNFRIADCTIIIRPWTAAAPATGYGTWLEQSLYGRVHNLDMTGADTTQVPNYGMNILGGCKHIVARNITARKWRHNIVASGTVGIGIICMFYEVYDINCPHSNFNDLDMHGVVAEALYRRATINMGCTCSGLNVSLEDVVATGGDTANAKFVIPDGAQGMYCRDVAMNIIRNWMQANNTTLGIRDSTFLRLTYVQKQQGPGTNPFCNCGFTQVGRMNANGTITADIPGNQSCVGF